jgi:thiol-disulfide isomerase/thioredoxin
VQCTFATRLLAPGTRRFARAAASAAALVFLAAGCGGDDSVAGGSDDLPGPVPADVSFNEVAEEGVQAHDFTATLMDGEPVQASELWDHRPIVLVFTASWCETCKDVHRAVAGVVERHEGVALLGLVPDDDAEGARDYAAELDLGDPLATAGDKVWLDYAAREPPVVVLVAPGGKVIRGWPGDVEPAVLERELEKLSAR